MRAILRSALLGTTAFTLSLFLASCGTAKTSGVNSSTGSGTGPVPTVTAQAVQLNGVAPNRKQELQFSEAMDPSSIDAKTFVVTDATGASAPGTVTYNADFNIASFQPDPALTTGAQYTATITTGAESQGGVHLAAPYSYSFTTRPDSDTSPIKVNSVTPAADAPCVSPTSTIVITFDEAPDAATINTQNIRLTDGSGNPILFSFSLNVTTTQVTLTPKSPLPTGTIALSVSNVGDLADVTMSSPFTSSFTVGSNCGTGGGTGGSGNSALLYVETNPSSGSNQLYGWTISGTGALQNVPGSPYNLGAGPIAVAQDFLFIAHAGTSSTTAAWQIGSDGSLAQGPVSSTGPDPSTTAGIGPLAFSTDRAQQNLYAQFSENGDYQAYSIQSNGSLSLLDSVPASESASWLSFTANDSLAYQTSCYHGTPSILGYSRSNTGALSVAYSPASPPQPTGLNATWCPYGAAVSGNSYVVISEVPTQEITPAGSAQLVTYSIAADGSLSTTDTASTAPTMNVGNNSGGNGTITAYRFDPTQAWLAVGGNEGIEIFHFVNGKLTPAGSFPLTNFWDLGWDSAGHLIVITGAYNTPGQVYVFNVVNGTPTPAPGSPVTLPAAANYLAVKPLS